MKQYFFFAAFFFSVLQGLAQNSRFELKGKVEGQEHGWLYLSYVVDEELVRDSCAIKNGQFSFAGALEEPVLAGLSGAVKSRSMDDPNYTNFFIEAGRTEVFLKKDDFKNAIIRGTSSQEGYASLVRKKLLIRDRYKVQLDSLSAERDTEKNAAIRERLSPYFTEMDQADYQFISEHPQSYVSAYLLRFHMSDLSLEELESIYSKLGEAVHFSSFGREAAAEIEKIRAGSPGSMAKEFSATDLNGNTLRLSDFRGQYVLLDFWASWCVPCRKGNPHLISLYKKYKSKGIEFIGIADDDRAEDAWRKAIEKDGIALWKHVRRGLKFENGRYDRTNDISENFGIHTLPTKILIDPKGKIIGRFGEDEAPLDKMLQEIFQQ